MSTPLNILGISAYYHDSAAALIQGGQVTAAAQEERFTRVKHTPDFPHKAVEYCLAESGLKLSDLDAVVFYDKPLLKFERLMETYHAYAPRGLFSYLKALPVWVKEKLFLRKVLWQELEAIEPGARKRGLKLLFSEHHLSHAASAFYPSPFEEAAVLTIDGVGEWATSTIGLGQGRDFKMLSELDFPHSVGLLYSAFTYYLGFKVNSGEYKLMGLAPYGNVGSAEVQKYKDLILDQLIDLKPDGSLFLNLDYFDFPVGLRMCNNARWEALFGLARRDSETELQQPHMDLALAIQQVTEEIVHRLAKTAQEKTGSKNLVMAGGVALNCVSNGKLLESGLFEKIWIQPAAGDAGGALGAALAVHHLHFEQERHLPEGKMDGMQGSYLGPEFGPIDIERMARRFKARFEKQTDVHATATRTAQLLSQGNVVGWFQGRMEWGPRALGNRSIIADARSEEMQKKLNLKIKFREGFRPFAPSVLAEERETYFDLSDHSPYMLLVAPVQESRRNQLPENYYSLPLYEKLYHLRSDIPSITHVDFSARVQTVHKETNPAYWELINAFKQETGYGLIVNTSFNVRGEPVVCTPEDAYLCFMRTHMDVLVVGDYVFLKDQQPEWKEEGDWREQYALD